MADVTIHGNIGSEPELRFTGGGDPVLNFSLAENHKRKNQQTGQWETVGTTWRKVTVWARNGLDPQHLSGVLKKGTPVIVAGPEQNREYTTRDGARGYSLEVTARLLGVIPYAPKNNAAQPPQAPQGGYQQQQQRPPQQQGPVNQKLPENPGGDPWGQQAGGNYDWGASVDGEPPF